MVFKFLTYPSRLNDLFRDAVHIWLLLDNKDALEVAIGAGLTAAKKQRESMIYYASTSIDSYRASFHAVGSDHIPAGDDLESPVTLSSIMERHHVLMESLTNLGGQSLLNFRRSMAQSNEIALRKGDNEYFRTKFPNFGLWSDNGPEQ